MPCLIVSPAQPPSAAPSATIPRIRIFDVPRPQPPNLNRKAKAIEGARKPLVRGVDNFMLAGSPSPSPSWRGSDSIRVLLFSLTLRGGQAVLRYYPRLLSSWPTSSTDAPRLWSIPEDVESSFSLRLQPTGVKMSYEPPNIPLGRRCVAAS